MNDRLRAKPPTTDTGRWWAGTVESVQFDEHEHRYAVRVTPAAGEGAPGDGTVTVRVTEAVYDLFTGRLDAADPVGERVWVR